MQINHLAFEGVACEEISLPACTNMSGACFYGSKIKKITHSPDVQLNGDVFYTCTELEELVPGRFRALSGLCTSVFQECNSLKNWILQVVPLLLYLMIQRSGYTIWNILFCQKHLAVLEIGALSV